MAKLIKTSGEILEIEPKRTGKKFSLDELQGYVGGYIEAVYLPNSEVMVCNEEGKLHGLPLNPVATAMVIAQLHQEIVGDVVVCKRREM